MRVLALADEECASLWDYFTVEKLKGIDLIIGCGDLCAEYLEFLATMAHVPVAYVHGNHDENLTEGHPGGVICLDDEVFVHNGMRIAGLGGSCRYRKGPWQFTEAEMKKRVRRLRRKIDRLGGVDILVTHAPLHGYGDLSDLPHRGFEAFKELLDSYHPAALIHGHVHLRYEPTMPREHRYNQTRLVNAFERVTLDIPDRPAPPPRRWWQRLAERG